MSSPLLPPRESHFPIPPGVLLSLPRTPALSARITSLFTELTSLVGHKRLLGHAPATEVFIVRRLAAYRTKHAAWVVAGRLPADSNYWDTIRISPAAGSCPRFVLLSISISANNARAHSQRSRTSGTRTGRPLARPSRYSKPSSSPYRPQISPRVKRSSRLS